jgi:MATE family multidrug resistance protein
LLREKSGSCKNVEVVAGLTVWPVISPMPDPTPHGFRAEVGAMVRLALPIVVVQLGQMLMGVVDTVMVGHVSAEAIAAVALGNLYFFGAAIFVGLPVSAALGFGAGAGPRGLWWGLTVGLALVAVVLIWRVRRRLKGEVARLVIDRDVVGA